MTHMKIFKWWETQVRNSEVTPQALWPITKSHMNRDGPKSSTTVHETFQITHHPNEKANVSTDCLENHFTSHGMCHQNHE
jgi:hypothetical protein